MSSYTRPILRIPVQAEARASVYCPICTHTVEATVIHERKTAWVKPAQKCTRCGGNLDAAFVLGLQRAA